MIDMGFESSLSSQNPSYLLKMVEAHFTKPGIFDLGRMSTAKSIARQWKRVFK